MVCAADNFTCADGEVKLVGGISNSTGTIQLCLNGQFGTICGDGFYTDDAQVVCSALGFQREGKAISWSTTGMLEGCVKPPPSTSSLHLLPPPPLPTPLHHPPPASYTFLFLLLTYTCGRGRCMEGSIPIEFQAMIVFLLDNPNMPQCNAKTC